MNDGNFTPQQRSEMNPPENELEDAIPMPNLLNADSALLIIDMMIYLIIMVV